MTGLAIGQDSGEAFIREVDEEYRRDRLTGFWNRYGRLLLLAVGILLIAVAGLLYWQAQRRGAADARGRQFAVAVAGLRAGSADKAKANAALAALADAPEAGYRALALLERGGAAAAAGDRPLAAKLYAQAAADADLAAPLRDLATYKLAGLEFDTAAPDATIARLRPLALPGGPWFGSAGEMTALAQLKAGRPDQARAMLDAVVKDERVPPSLRARVGQLLASLGGPVTVAAKGAIPPSKQAGTRP